MKYFFSKHDYDTDADYAFFIFYIVTLIALVATYLFFQMIPDNWAYILGICPLHKMTGLYCPGCGGTRAIKALIHIHPLQSLYYHPIPLYGGTLGVLFLFGRTLARCTKGRINILHAKTFFLWLALILIIVNCLLKNYLLLFCHIQVMK